MINILYIKKRRPETFVIIANGLTDFLKICLRLVPPSGHACKCKFGNTRYNLLICLILIVKRILSIRPIFLKKIISYQLNL